VNATTVVIGDRSMTVRAVLRRLLEGTSGIGVIGDAADGAEVARLVVEHAPNAVILDLDLPSLGGRALVERITTRTHVPIFVLVPKRSRENTRVAMSLHNLGVVAVFPKPETPEEWTALGKTLS